MTRSELRVLRIAIVLDEFTPQVRKVAAAITVSEMGFRGIFHRFAEYTAAACLIALGRNAGSISVGVSQVSLRHTMRLYGFSPGQALLFSSDPRNSIKSCCKLLQTFSQLEIDHAILEYNGRSSPFYRMRVRVVFEEIEAVLAFRQAQVGAV